MKFAVCKCMFESMCVSKYQCMYHHCTHHVYPPSTPTSHTAATATHCRHPPTHPAHTHSHPHPLKTQTHHPHTHLLAHLCDGGLEVSEVHIVAAPDHRHHQTLRVGRGDGAREAGRGSLVFSVSVLRGHRPPRNDNDRVGKKGQGKEQKSGWGGVGWVGEGGGFR